MYNQLYINNFHVKYLNQKNIHFFKRGKCILKSIKHNNTTLKNTQGDKLLFICNYVKCRRSNRV